MSSYFTHQSSGRDSKGWISRSRPFAFDHKYALLVVSLLFLGTLRIATLLRPVGRLALAASLFLGLALLLAYGWLRRDLNRPATRSLLFWAGLLPGVYVVRWLMEGCLWTSARFVAITVLMISYFLAMSLYPWSSRGLQTLSIAATGFLAVQFFWWIAVGRPSQFASYYLNPNGLGALVFYFSFFSLLRRDRTLWAATIAVVLVLTAASGARSVMLALTATALTYVLWGVIVKKRWLFHGYLALTLVCVGVGMFLYVSAASAPDHLASLNKVVIEVTDEALFSGRERLWVPLVHAIEERPLMGHGPSTTPLTVMGSHLSAHNLYIQVALQVGLIGVAALLGLLTKVWNIYWLGRSDPIVRLSAAFLMGTIVYQVFEVTLTQSILAIGMVQWVILGVGVSRALGIDAKKQAVSTELLAA